MVTVNLAKPTDYVLKLISFKSGQLQNTSVRGATLITTKRVSNDEMFRAECHI